jgi:tetratricopeptide (TPR) repeat protein
MNEEVLMISEESVRKAKDLFKQAALEWNAQRSGNARYFFEELIELGEADSTVASLDFFPLSYYILGIIYAGQQSVGRSIVYFEKAFQLGFEKTVYDCRRLGAGYLIMGKNSEAIAVLNEAVKCNEKDVGSRRSLVRAYLNLYRERKRSEFYDFSLIEKAQIHNEILKSTAPYQALGPENFWY